MAKAKKPVPKPKKVKPARKARKPTAKLPQPFEFEFALHMLQFDGDQAATFHSVGASAQRLARVFGDRQNSPSTLKPREAEAVVTILLNCGNLMTKLAEDQYPHLKPKPQEPKEKK